MLKPIKKRAVQTAPDGAGTSAFARGTTLLHPRTSEAQMHSFGTLTWCTHGKDYRAGVPFILSARKRILFSCPDHASQLLGAVLWRGRPA